MKKIVRNSSLKWATLLTIFLIFAPISLNAEPTFNDIPETPEIIPLRDSLGLRLGFISSGLFSSNQGRPFFYFDAGMRFKNENAYFDLRLPAFVAGLDFLFFTFQESILNASAPFNFFESMNTPLQYGAFVEPISFRLGQTWVVNEKNNFRLSAGIGFQAEFVFFDLALFDDRDLEEFEPREDPNAADPFIVAPGAFIAFGGDFTDGEFDIAIGGGPDVFQDSAYSANSGALVYIDADVQYDVSEDVGISLRSRVATYTHTEDLVFTLVVGGGVILRLY